MRPSGSTRGEIPADDPALFAELRPRLPVGVMGVRFLACHETGSTNSVALALAALDEPEGSVVVADYQTAGRGRQGRGWAAPPGTSLLVSILLRPTCPPERIPQMSLVSGVALRETLALVGVECQLKWPNDLLLCGKKVGGILLEAGSGSLGRPVVVVGVGLNCNQARDDFPPELRGRAISVAIATGRPVDRTTLLELFLSSLDRWYATYLRDGFGPVRVAWLEAAAGLGQWVHLDGLGVGRVTDLASDGSLILEVPSGGRLQVRAGEISDHAVGH